MKRSHQLTQLGKATAGFTLVELLVSLALFTIAMTISLGSLYTVSAAAKRVRAMRTVLDNLNFALESMSRSIRTGANITCGNLTTLGAPQSCSVANGYAGTTVSFKSTLGVEQNVEYTWDSAGTFCGGIGAQCIEKITQDKNGLISNPVAITSPEIKVTSVRFYVDGNNPGGVSDYQQPNVIVIVSGTATVDDQVAPFTVQTYISQRTIE
jgi:prepilin-type N-terminal cleavage/methylation domain-containing protein